MRSLAPLCIVISLPSIAIAQKSQTDLQAKIQELIKKGVPGASTKVALYQEAQALYEEYLSAYPNASDANEARFGYAEVLFRLGELGDKTKWPSAAKQYQQVLSADAKGPRSAESALGVLVTTEHWAEQLPASQDVTPEAEAILAVYQDLYAKVSTDLKREQGNIDVGGQCAFRLGELYSRYQKSDEALTWFEKGLADFPTSSSKEASATQLLVVLLSRGKTDELTRYINRFKADKELSQSKPFTDALSQLEAQLEVKSCLSLFEKKSWLPAAKCFESAAQKPGDRGAELFFNGAVSYKQARQPEDALRLFQEVLAKYPKSKEAKYSLLQVGSAAFAFLDFDVAAASFEEYAKKYPAEKEIEQALQDAATIRFASLQYEEAAALLTKKAALLESTRPKEADEVYASLVTLREEQGDPAKVQSAAEKLLKRKGLSTILVANAYASLGHSYWQRGKKSDAEKQCTQAISYAKELKDEVELDESSVSRCAFYLGELKVQKTEALAIPKTLDEKSISDWIKTYRAAIDDTRTSLNQVKDFGATRWALGALFRAGEMSYLFSSRLNELSTSLKDKSKLTPEAIAALQPQISAIVGASAKDAESAWSTCAEGVSLVRDPGPWLEQCEEKLYTLNPILYPLKGEWVASPTTDAIPVFAPRIVNKTVVSSQ